MSWIVVTRNPRTRKIVLMMDERDGLEVAEFASEGKARTAGNASPMFRAWDFLPVEIEDEL